MAVNKKLGIKINFSKFGASKRSAPVILAVVLFALLCMELLVVKNSISLISQLNSQPAVPTSSGVRINFDAYNQAVQRITQGKTYQPDAQPAANPFVNSVKTGQ